MVHHCMLSRPRRHLDDRECRRHDQGVALGHRTASGGGHQNGTVVSGERREGNGNRGGADGGGTRRHGSALPSAPAHMGQVTADMEHGPGG